MKGLAEAGHFWLLSRWQLFMSFAPKLILDLSGLTFSLPLPAPLEFGSLAVIGVVLVSCSDSAQLRTLYCPRSHLLMCKNFPDKP